MLAKAQKLDSTVCCQSCKKISMLIYLTLRVQNYTASVERNSALLFRTVDLAPLWPNNPTPTFTNPSCKYAHTYIHTCK